MKLRNIFELKQKNTNTGGLYPQIVRIHGQNTPQYADGKYRTIAREGYSENWIIFRCLQEIIQAAIQLQWVVCKKNKDGKKEPIPNHPIQTLIEKPNKLYSQAEFIKRAIAFYYIGGDAPIVKMTVRGNIAKELYTYRPDKTTMELTGNIDMPYANIRYEGQQAQDIKPEQFMLWKNFNPLDEFDGLGRGMPVVKPILKNGDLLQAMVDWNVSLMQNGGQVSGVISTAPGESLTKTQYERAKTQLNNEYGGTKNVGKWMLLEGGATASQMGTNPKDMDWNNGKEGTMKDICIGIGVDPLIVGFNESASYNNKNEAEKGLYTKTVIPLMQNLAGQLGTFLGLQDGEFFDIDYSHIPVLQEDIKELNDKLDNPDITINEKRQARGYEPVKGGDVVINGSYAIMDGQVYLPMNMIPVTESTPQDTNPQNNTQQNKSFMY